ncbi:MAG TPA: hypothetical protein DDY68_00495, partial [Porphyromonadaceae bacterium]|nr:hypothetical protein [Porphyromonadaceae bacterium]
PVVKKSWEVDYKLLVIIAVFSYLLAVICIKLIDYNWGRKRSVIDVIFLTLLFTCLFFPMSSLNKEEISTQENRTLAKWKSIFLPNGNLNFDFG